jgi:hypothetical protein
MLSCLKYPIQHRSPRSDKKLMAKPTPILNKGKLRESPYSNAARIPDETKKNARPPKTEASTSFLTQALQVILREISHTNRHRGTNTAISSQDIETPN